MVPVLIILLPVVQLTSIEILPLPSMLVALELGLGAAGKTPLCMVVVAAGVTELEGAGLWW
jgi:hypothetical protein